MSRRERKEAVSLEVNIYIDTDIKGPQKKDGAYIYILSALTAKGTADAGNMKVMENATENSLTLAALGTALKRVNGSCSLVLWLECPYVAAALENRWFENWEKNGWMTSRKEPVKDAEKWQNILKLLDGHDFEVRLKEPHTYREWMRRTLREPETFRTWLQDNRKNAGEGTNCREKEEESYV